MLDAGRSARAPQSVQGDDDENDDNDYGDEDEGDSDDEGEGDVKAKAKIPEEGVMLDSALPQLLATLLRAQPAQRGH